MSSENADVTYKEGDIVWVKLGSTWWPCEVRDSGPPEVEFKKPPLAVVKFFDEDTYEYIRSFNQICPYNCEKKTEFIKKGMAAFRSNVSHMQKFPRDVTNAEILVGGNPNILSEPMFIPEKKRPHSSDVVQSKTHITHRRFLGVEDYNVFICVQSPEKNRIPGDKDDDEVILLNTEPEKNYNCHDCHFTTKRLEVMVIHKKNHSLYKNDSKPSKKRPAVSKTKKDKIKKARSSSNKDSCENKEKRTSSNKKKKSILSETNKFIDNKDNETPRNASDIRSDLLAEWDDDDEEMDNSIKSQSTEIHEETDTTTMSGVTDMTGVSEVNDTTIASEANDTSIVSEANDASIVSEANDASIVSEANDASIVSEANDTSIVSEANDTNIVSEVNNTSIISDANDTSIVSEANDMSIISETNDTSVVSETNDTSIVSETNVTSNVSEAMVTSIVSEAMGTSIVSEANDTSTVSEVSDASIVEETGEKTSECPATFADDFICIAKEESSNAITATVESHNISEDHSNVHKNKKMDQATEQAIKSCFDFDEEDEEEGSVIISTTVTGRKIPRVIPLAGKRKSTDVSIESSSTKTEEEMRNKYELDIAFNELMETTNVPELPDLQRTLKCEQNFHKSKAIKFPDKQIEKNSNPTNNISGQKMDLIEVATKLTNPKKRFVKSFEDFELKQSVSKKIEEQSQNKNNKEGIMGEIGKINEKYVDINTASPDFLKFNTPIVPKNTQDGSVQELEDNITDQSEKIKEDQKDYFKLIESGQLTTAGKPSSSPGITDQPEKMKEDEKDYIKLIESGQLTNAVKPSSSPGITDQPEKMKEDEKDYIKLIESGQLTNAVKPSSSPDIIDKPEKMKESERDYIKLIESGLITNADEPSSSPDITHQPEKMKDEKDYIKLIEEANADEPSSSPVITDQPEKMKEDEEEDKPIDSKQMTNADEPRILPNITDQPENMKEDEEEDKPIDSKQMTNADEPRILPNITDQPEKMEEDEEEDKPIDSKQMANADEPRILPNITDQPEKMKEDEEEDKPIDSKQMANADEPRILSNITDQPEKMEEDEEEDKPIDSKQMANADEPRILPNITDQPEKMKEDEEEDKPIDSKQMANADKPRILPNITDQPDKIKEDEKVDIKLMVDGPMANADESSSSHDITDQQIKEDGKDEIKMIDSRQMTNADKFSSSHKQTPRSKILEMYFSRNSKEKLENTTVSIFNPSSSEIKHNIPPKKKLHARISHPKKDKTLFSFFLNEETGKNGADQMDFIETKLQSPEKNKTNESLEKNESETNAKYVVQSRTNIASKTNLGDATAISKPIESIEPNYQQITSNKNSEKSTNLHLEVCEEFSGHEGRIQEENRDVKEIISCSSYDHTDTSPQIPTNFESEIREKQDTSNKDNGNNSNDNDNISEDKKYLTTQTMETSCSLETLFITEREEHPELEKATTCLPDDAICSPPRKRKQSEVEISAQLDQSDSISKKLKRNDEFDLSNKNVIIQSNDKDTGDFGILMEVSECVHELITKVSESQPDSSENQKTDYEMITETSESKLNDISSDKTTTNNGFCETEIRKNEQIEEGVETLPNINDQDGSKISYESDNENLSVPCSLSEDSHIENFEQCQVSDYVNEEIVEEVIYGTEQDALVEELIETHEDTTDIDNMSPDIKDGDNCNESDNIVDIKDNSIQNSKHESLNETTEFNLVSETSKAVPDITQFCKNVQITKKYCLSKNSLCKAEEHLPNKKSLPENIVDKDNSPQKENHLQSNLSNFSDSRILRTKVASDSQLTTICDNTPGNKGMSPRHSIKEHEYSDHLINVEGNLTVVSEMELAEGQVEITPEQIISSSKIINPSHFYPDLSDSTNDSSSATDLIELSKGLDSRATTKEKKHVVGKEVGVAFGRTELLSILEGDSDSDKKKIKVNRKKSYIEDFCDFEDHIPSQIVCATRLKQEKDDDIIDRKDKGFKTKKNYKIASTTSKLLERLTETKKDVKNLKTDVTESVSETPPSKVIKGKPSSSKPIILSEQIIKPPSEQQKSTYKEALNDIEDLETFIIHKDTKKPNSEKDLMKPSVEKKNAKVGKNAGKAKILQQTIITASGEIIQPAVTLAQSDENIFDINSMPIVLSDSILTPENIEKMTVVLSNSQSTTSPIITPTSTVVMAGRRSVDNKTIAKLPSTLAASVAQPSTSSLNVTAKSSRTPRILQSSSSRIIHRGTSTNSSKPGKFILVPQAATLPSTKGVVKKMVLKRSPVVQNKQTCNTSEVSGNKIMILTNQQGQQQRLLLTPAQQKILGCQPQIPKVPKTIIKGNMQSSTAITKTVIAPTETKSVPESNLPSTAEQSVLLVNSQIAADKKIVCQTSNVPQVIKTAKSLQTNYRSSQNAGKVQQTLLLKKQTVKRIKESNEDLEKQVAEQLEAIKASSGVKIESRVKTPETIKTTSKHVTNQSFIKKNEPRYKIMPTSVKGSKSEEAKSPILTSINSKQSGLKEPVKSKELKVPPERPINQLVVQDALGNQTTIVEGQILALPSETINGQPQSYILVTLDQTGTLTPLNNEALMSLDPNLELGGDIGNTVLQIEQGTLTSAGTSRPVASPEPVIIKSSKGVGNVIPNNLQEQVDIRNATKLQSSTSANDQLLVKPKVTDVLLSNQNVEQTVASNANTGAGQQLIISGDPLATQKFLESLTEGTTDLANLLANADSNGILIHTDGQQILINTESNSQMLLSVNNENAGVTESSSGNPIFATQLNKSQDILAAALADTDVFQQEQNLTQNKFSSQLSPNNSLYPINVGNVLETSLTLSSPIMTPLEVPSTNNKKIPDEEADILTQVPKNVDLPITITDPNISQTVANQQVASFITTELQSNLELNLPMSEPAISSVSKDLHSHSFSYALSTLEDSEDITQKTFNSSMPLLSEDAEETADMTKTESETHHKKYQNSSFQKYKVLKDTLHVNKRESVERTSFLEEDDEEEKGRFTLGRQMCSSLSEPPPEMFDLVDVNSSFVKNSLPTSLQSTPDSVERAKDDELTDISIQADNSSDGSCEIPVQPKIIAKSQNLDLLNSD